MKQVSRWKFILVAMAAFSVMTCRADTWFIFDLIPRDTKLGFIQGVHERIVIKLQTDKQAYHGVWHGPLIESIYVFHSESGDDITGVMQESGPYSGLQFPTYTNLVMTIAFTGDSLLFRDGSPVTSFASNIYFISEPPYLAPPQDGVTLASYFYDNNGVVPYLDSNSLIGLASATDDITFELTRFEIFRYVQGDPGSPPAIPEPSTWMLISLGVIVFWQLRRRIA